MKTRGLALIVVVGILGVLAILVVAFVAMAQMERRASAQRVNAARAYLLARSGIEDALARLEAGQDPAYGGEDWQMDGDQGPGSFDRQQEVYRRGELNVADCPVRHALRPSFFTRDALGRPVLQAVDGRQRGYSGALAGDHAPEGNAYVLKAAAEGSEGQGFYINGGDPSVSSDPTQTSDYNTNLRRMLGILAKAITEGAGDKVAGLTGLSTLTEADGWALIDARPKEGWKDWEQVRKLALGGSQAKLDALKPYLALHAYVDRKAIAPHVSPAILDPNGMWFSPVTGNESAKAYHSWGEAKLDPARGETRRSLRAPDFEKVSGKLVGRAPVDFSWARGKRPALVALLGGLKGLYLDEASASPVRYGDVLGFLRAAEVTLDWDPTDICHKMADRIQASASELNTWQQWQGFCDALPDATVMSTQDYAAFLTYSATNPFNHPKVFYWLKGQAVRDILKANFNPNSDLNKFSPNLSVWKTVDKGDLLVYSTEFSLLPVPYGHQEVSSVGRILDRRGGLLASRALKALLAGSPPVRLSTQREFVSEELGALGIAGDETRFRLPDQAGIPFISLSQGGAKTWGHAFPALGGQGASLQTYPEPMVDDGTLSIHPADYDGSIQSATVETAKDAFYGATGPRNPPVTGAPYRKMTMLARYTGNFDLDVSAADPDGTGSRIAPFHITPRQNHPDLYQVTSHCTGEPGKVMPDYPYYQPARQKDSGPPNLEELRYSLLRAGDPVTGDYKLNTLYPDGCYSEKDRAPEYLDKDNADGFHGVMSFWIKANHLPPMGSNNGRGQPILNWTNFGGVADEAGSSDASDQFFFWGDQAHYSESPVVIHFEIGHSPGDLNQEHEFGVGRHLIPHRWELLTCRWDFRAPLLADDTMEVLLNAGRAGAAPFERGTQSASYATVANDPTLASDITVDDLSQRDGNRWIKGPHCLPLGDRGRREWEKDGTLHFGSGADATFDEFALYDFGGAGPEGELPVDYAETTKASPEVLAAARFPEGRYYKGSAYFGLGDSRNTAAEWFSAPIRLGDGSVRLRGLAWTQIVPSELRSSLPAVDASTVAGLLPAANGVVQAVTGGDLPPDGAISFELVNEAGTAYALDLGGNQLLTNPAFSPVNRSLRGAFRLHAVFQPNLADPENTPILDPLTLDDVTVYYEPLGGLRITAWDSAPPGD